MTLAGKVDFNALELKKQLVRHLQCQAQLLQAGQWFNSLLQLLDAIGIIAVKGGRGAQVGAGKTCQGCNAVQHQAVNAEPRDVWRLHLTLVLKVLICRLLRHLPAAQLQAAWGSKL